MKYNLSDLINIAKDYFINSLGLEKSSVELLLMENKFSNCYCSLLPKSNVILKNKIGLKGNETHIAFTSVQRNVFYSDSEISNFEISGSISYVSVPVDIISANLYSSLKRRDLIARTEVDKATVPSKTYPNNFSIITTSATKWLGKRTGQSTQVYIGKTDSDGSEFKDFRIGLLIGDLMIVLRYETEDKYLMISIPSEFVNVKYPNLEAEISKKYFEKKPSLNKTKEELEDDSIAAAEDIIYKEAISRTVGKDTGLIPLEPPKGKNIRERLTYPRDPAIGKGAIEKAQYKCCLNPEHTTFITNAGIKYMEPHHLIPISKQGLFANSLDITPNIISLCPICHCRIHYGTKADKKQILKKFYDERISDLKHCGIDLDFETLFGMYI